ncbi:MAG: ABC-2 family transporter protein [Deltaproteobacteria bacterium]|nr:ABC-2 family transporter protein [Deltaproteobacteria bacterium]
MIHAIEWRWIPHLFSIEIRRVLSYRVDFWLNLFCSLFAKVGLAYFVWKEIFHVRGVDVIAGYDFHAMMMYYVVSAFIYEVNSVDLGFFSRDIYDGTLTRYLIFPLPFFGYKYVTCLSRAAVLFVQVGVALALFYFTIGIPEGLHISASSIVLGTAATLLAGYLMFVVLACLDLTAFWADKVWSLGVIMQLTTQFLGGVYLPIQTFPEWAQSLVTTLPFFYIIAFPVRTLFGELSSQSLMYGFILAALWAMVFTLLARVIWRRGMLRYSGVGQ